MIIGEFGLMGRPFVEGYLRLPRFDLTTNITFLVDTLTSTPSASATRKSLKSLS